MITVLGAGLLVGTALTVIIPEGVRSLHASQKGADLPSLAIYKYAITNAPLEKINDYSQTIGISLVLGFVFMMLIDQFSQKRQNSTAISDKAITATLGLVVHAAGNSKKVKHPKFHSQILVEMKKEDLQLCKTILI